VQHEVNMQHDKGEVNLPFSTTVGGMQLTPDQVDIQAAGDRAASTSPSRPASTCPAWPPRASASASRA
jgi:hypothetical protein